MFFAEPIWAGGHDAASKGRTHDRIRAATDLSIPLLNLGPFHT
jgi:hypothetical protein